MLEGLLQMESGDHVISFVRNFYGRRITCVCGGRDGHRTRGKEGRGDALMSLLFRQHHAFVAIQARLQWEENSASGRCPHDLAGRALGACQDQGASRQDTGVEQRRFPSDRGRRIDQGRGSQTWKGDLDLPVDPQGPASAGRPNRHTGMHVVRQLKAKPTGHAILLDWIPAVAVVQAASLLLFCLGSTRANF